MNTASQIINFLYGSQLNYNWILRDCGRIIKPVQRIYHWFFRGRT